MAKEVNEKELEQVAGGFMKEEHNYKVHYKDVKGGESFYHKLEKSYNGNTGYREAIKDGKAWCEENNKYYVSTLLDD